MKKPDIKRIMIPVDFSATGQLAMEHAAFMAQTFGAELYILHVIELSEYSYTVFESSSMALMDSDVEAKINTMLKQQSDEIAAKYGLSVIPVVANGRVYEEIEETAKAKNIDLIVMGTHGAKGFEEFIIGSNANKIAKNSPCPVITVKANTPHMGFNNILVPIDNTMHSRQKVDYVIEFAKQFGAFVHLLGIESEDDELLDEKKFMIKIGSVEKAFMKESIPFRLTMIRSENVAQEVMKWSKEVNADLIVIMSDHESHISFSKQIVNHAKVPVMSITPMKVEYETLDLSAVSNPFANF